MKKKYPMTPKRLAAICTLICILALIVFAAIYAFTATDSTKVATLIIPALILVPVFVYLCTWSLSGILARGKDSHEANDLIDTVVLDIGNVLVGFAPKEFFAQQGLDEQLQERVLKACFQNGVWNEYDRGVLTADEVAERIAAEDLEIRDVILRVLTSFRGMLHRYEYTPALIHSLQESGYKVYLLSNFSEKALQDCKEELTFIDDADGALLSYRDKIIKPDPKIYELLFERFKLTPSKCVFLDDTPANIEGAIAAGMKGIVFKSLPQAAGELEKLGVYLQLSELDNYRQNVIE